MHDAPSRCRRLLANALAAALALLLRPGAGVAQDQALFEPIWIEPLAGPAALMVPAVLILPAGWATGDAAVLLLIERAAPLPGRERLVTALIDSGAAVLELEPESARDVAADSAAAVAALPGTGLLLDIAAALRSLWRDAGAGLVVAVGEGVAGEAVLQAARTAGRRPQAVPEGPGLAAAVAIGPAGPRFAAGAVLPPEQGWPTRAALFCRLLADALAPPGAEPVPESCLAALLPWG